jgi:hypothetical protein
MAAHDFDLNLERASPLFGHVLNSPISWNGIADWDGLMSDPSHNHTNSIWR